MKTSGSVARANPDRALRRAFCAFLAALVVLVVGFLVLLGASLYEAGRANAISRVVALEQYVRRSLEVSAVVADEAQRELGRRASLEGIAKDADAHAYFADLVAKSGLTEGMIFVDAEGVVQVHSGAFPATPVDLSDRAWFDAHLAGSDRAIDGSFVSRVTRTLIFVQTFALRDDAGKLLGVINIGIPSSNIIGMQALPFTEQGIVTAVMKETGELIARDPFPEALIGARIDLPENVPDGEAIYERRATDGRHAITAYSRLADVGLAASVSIPLIVVMQPLVRTGALTVILLLLVFAGGLALLRRLEAQQRDIWRGSIRLETVLEASSLCAWQWTPKTDTSHFLGRWFELLGHDPESLGPQAWRDLLHPEEKDHVIRNLERHLRGETAEFREEHRLRHKAGHWVWVLDCGRVVERDAKGKPELMIGIHLDISERRESEERMKTVSLEVDHRSKNLLAVVQALVSITNADDVAGFKTSLRGRVGALGRAHDLLSQSRWTGTDLQTVAQEELGYYIADKGDQITVDGPKVVFGASAIQALSMILHELATNAAKHGALADPEGRLQLTWTIPDDGLFEIHWDETVNLEGRHSDPVAGFGTRLMTMLVKQQLGGELEVATTDTGLRCRIRLPRDLLVCPGDRPAPPRPRATERRHRPDGTGARVLLVEDEALIAADAMERLEEAGFIVAATASSLHEAELAATTADIDAAVLDVNLRGEQSFPVADILNTRGLPFVFVTGYQAAGLFPDRFKEAQVVRKPAPPGSLEQALRQALTPEGAEESPQPIG